MIIPATLLQLVPQLLVLHLQPVCQSLEVFVFLLKLSDLLIEVFLPSSFLVYFFLDILVLGFQDKFSLF